MRRERFAADTVLFKEGDYGDEAYRVISGKVEIVLDEGASEMVLASLGPGEIFGEMGMIERRPRSAGARVVEDSELEVIKEQDFLSWLGNGGHTLAPYLATLFERLRRSNERLRELRLVVSARGEASSRASDAESTAPVPPRKRWEGRGEVTILADSPEMQAQSSVAEREVRDFPCLIGRRSEIAGVDVFARNHLRVADSAPFSVSRMHCAIEKEGGAYIVRDSGSHLGTIVNGVSIGAQERFSEARLKPGANTLVLGPSDSRFRFTVTVHDGAGQTA